MNLVDIITLKPLTKRKLLGLVHEKSLCVEIGVWKGDFSRLILQKLKPKRLYLIDPWKFEPKYKKRWYGGKVARSQKDMDEIYRSVKKRLGKHKNVEIIRKPSEEAVSNFKTNSVDFIYIDGDHSFEYVYKDLESYFPKLKVGGILAGDDYFWGIRGGMPVRAAVKKFADRKALEVRLIGTQFLLTKQ